MISCQSNVERELFLQHVSVKSIRRTVLKMWYGLLLLLISAHRGLEVK